MIPMLDLIKEYEFFRGEIEEAIREVMSHQQWINGPEVKRFEEEVAHYLGVRFAVGVNSGTDALVVGLRALCYARFKKERFDPEDEIITTPFTFTATGEAILRAGATPVFVDVDEDYNISPEEIKGAINERTRGVVVVHLFGNPCRMEEIRDIAEKKGLFVLEDVAQAFGSVYRGKKVGTIGDVGAFSFFPSKNLGGFGDGGLIVTDREEIRDLCICLRNHGGRDKYNVEFCGYNSRLDTIQAAILLRKLKYIDEFIKRRREVADIYSQRLKDVEEVKLPVETTGGYHTYHQFTIRLPSSKRERVIKGLKDEGVSSMVYYPVPLHRMKVFSNRSKVYNRLANSERYANEVLSLPIGPMQDRETTIRIADTLIKVLRGI